MSKAQPAKQYKFETVELNDVITAGIENNEEKSTTDVLDNHESQAKGDATPAGNLSYEFQQPYSAILLIEEFDKKNLPLTDEQREFIHNAIRTAINDFYGRGYNPSIPITKSYDIAGDILSNTPDFSIGLLTISNKPYITITPHANTFFNTPIFKPVRIDLSNLPKAVLTVPGYKWYSLLKFQWIGTETGSRLETIAKGDLPVIKLDYAEKEFTKLNTLIKWEIAPANNSLQAYINYTRLSNLIITRREIHISFNGLINIKIEFEQFSEETKQQELQAASIYRKLAFIADTIQQPISLSETIKDSDLETIEIVFLALTEGKFYIKSKYAALPPIKLSRKQVIEPPFTRPCSLGYDSEETMVNLFGTKISLGNMRVYIPQAKLIDESIIDKVFKDPDKEYAVTFAAMDHQVIYVFDQYNETETQAKNKQALIDFTDSLKGFESEEIIKDIQKSLLLIDTEEAHEIAQGWLEFHTLSSSFKVGEALIKPSITGEDWQFPILWYSGNAVKGVIGTIIVNSTTTFVTTEPTLKEIRLNSMRLAAGIQKEGIDISTFTVLRNLSDSAGSHSYFHNRYHHAVVIIKDINDDSDEKIVTAIIPSWHPEKEIKFPSKIIEDQELAASLVKDTMLMAAVNLTAKNIDELNLRHFTILKKRDKNDDI